jgi:hypothetical protein
MKIFGTERGEESACLDNLKKEERSPNKEQNQKPFPFQVEAQYLLQD